MQRDGKLDAEIGADLLVKGAYWDTEIKRAQVEGLSGFPVFTRKAATDVSYMLCAGKLLQMTDRIYPQFATHNAHTVAAILEMATDRAAFEFQRLQGMGEALHAIVLKREKTRCRIYAPVGTHRDLLAYLVRRLLENGANSSFVNQIVDEDVPPATVAADPFETLDAASKTAPSAVKAPADLFGDTRVNSRGWDLHDLDDLAAIEDARGPFRTKTWTAGPLLATKATGGEMHTVINPAKPEDTVGQVTFASNLDVASALSAAENWSDVPAKTRGDVLRKAADLYQDAFGELFALLSREAGKTPADAIAELREAVDFLRYYANQCEASDLAPARGLITCISPWNFPLAIFTGQIAAALAAGNGVLAKPAETTSLIAAVATGLLHQAGVPRPVLQLLPGLGSKIGAALTSDSRLNGVCFTGSTATAQRINRAMVEHIEPHAPLIAETGGLNAMIVDSTALPEQAIRDIVNGAFRSAGQRCSALRVLYLQEDIAPAFLDMLYGAMDELVIGDPWFEETDLGPVITAAAQAEIQAHVLRAKAEGRLLKHLKTPANGHFVAPAVIEVAGIQDLSREIFGPVLHVATFKGGDISAIVDAINATGYGLTFGMHSRIDDRVEEVTSRLNVGNMYVNRNQIGAVVGSQPFGGEGLSGTGPKAGGPDYLPRFTRAEAVETTVAVTSQADTGAVARLLAAVAGKPTGLLDSTELPGPTGESNRLSRFGRGVVLCLGPSLKAAKSQARIARENGCFAVVVAEAYLEADGLSGTLNRADLTGLEGFDLVALWSDEADLRAARHALAARAGRLIPLVTGRDLAERCRIERHICIDTTASGGNASLLASVKN